MSLIILQNIVCVFDNDKDQTGGNRARAESIGADNARGAVLRAWRPLTNAERIRYASIAARSSGLETLVRRSGMPPCDSLALPLPDPLPDDD